MKNLSNNKKFISTFKVLSFIYMVISFIMMIYAMAMNMYFITTQYLFFPGLVVTNISLLFVMIFILGNNMKNVNFFKRYKWIIWIMSIAACLLLGISIYHVMYRLWYTAFPQAIGHDQGAYWNQNRPFVYLSVAAIILNVFAIFITIFVKDKGSLLKGNSSRIFYYGTHKQNIKNIIDKKTLTQIKKIK